MPAPGVMQDLQAAVQHAAQAGKVGIVGYCWGGLLTWRAACDAGRTCGGGAVLRRRHDHAGRDCAPAQGAGDGALRRPGPLDPAGQRRGLQAGPSRSRGPPLPRQSRLQLRPARLLRRRRRQARARAHAGVLRPGTWPDDGAPIRPARSPLVAFARRVAGRRLQRTAVRCAPALQRRGAVPASADRRAGPHAAQRRARRSSPTRGPTTAPRRWPRRRRRARRA